MELKMYSQISRARQKLIEIIQSLGFGVIDLDVTGGEPCFDPPPKVLQDIKIGSDSESQHERSSGDFALTSRLVELFEHLDRVAHGKIKIEVKHSQPFRLTIERTDRDIDSRPAAKRLR